MNTSHNTSVKVDSTFVEHCKSLFDSKQMSAEDIFDRYPALTESERKYIQSGETQIDLKDSIKDALNAETPKEKAHKPETRKEKKEKRKKRNK